MSRPGTSSKDESAQLIFRYGNRELVIPPELKPEWLSLPAKNNAPIDISGYCFVASNSFTFAITLKASAT